MVSRLDSGPADRLVRRRADAHAGGLRHRHVCRGAAGVPGAARRSAPRRLRIGGGLPDAGAGGPRGVVRRSPPRSRQRRGPGQRRVVAERRSDRPLGRVGSVAARCAGHRRRPAALRIDCRRRPALADPHRHDAGQWTVGGLAGREIRGAPARAAVGSAEGPRAGSAAGDRPGGPRRIPPRAPGAGADRSSCGRSHGA